MAKKIGAELALADIEPENSQLSEDELNTVSGGKSGCCFCALAGGGGSKDDFTCFCALGGGMGNDFAITD